MTNRLEVQIASRPYKVIVSIWYLERRFRHFDKTKVFVWEFPPSQLWAQGQQRMTFMSVYFTESTNRQTKIPINNPIKGMAGTIS